MRQIKFRAWLKEKKEMVNVYHWHRGDELDRIEVMTGFTHSSSFLSNEYELMQFTGLLDKNGKEIFEGDVLKNDTWVGNVIYIAPEFKFDDGKSIFSVSFKDFEIIGNIYEHPELITPANQPG